MPTFVYEGTSPLGEKKRGFVDANDQAGAERKLQNLHITPTKVRLKGWMDLDLDFSFLGGSVTTKDIVIFTRQFSTMIDAGLPLVQCLDILASQTDNKGFAKILAQVKADVEGGSTFADALKRHPKVFDDLFVNLVAAGEVGGILDTIMQRLAAYIEKNHKLIKEVKSAMTYPIAVMIVAVIIVFFLLWKVIPVFAQMFKDAGTALPTPTQIVVDLSDWLLANLVYCFFGLVGIIVGIKLIMKTRQAQVMWDRVKLHLPVFGDLLRKMAVAKFTRTLGTMVSSGVPIMDALNIVAKTAGNIIIERGIMYVREKVSEGKTVAEPMVETKLFPSMVCQMVSVGEATGAMDAMLNKIAEFYEDEVDTAVTAFKSLLEPLIMVFLGVILGGLVIVMYLPIFNMGAAVGGR